MVMTMKSTLSILCLLLLLAGGCTQYNPYLDISESKENFTNTRDIQSARTLMRFSLLQGDFNKARYYGKIVAPAGRAATADDILLDCELSLLENKPDLERSEILCGNVKFTNYDYELLLSGFINELKGNFYKAYQYYVLASQRKNKMWPNVGGDKLQKAEKHLSPEQIEKVRAMAGL